MGASLELRKFLAPEFVFGQGSLSLAGRYAKSLAATKVLIVTDPGIITAGWTEKVEASVKASNISYAVFHAVTPNPKDHEVMAGVEVYNREECDLILSVGGGSVTDCAKGIGIATAAGANINSFEGIDQVRIPGPPLICIPTTAGAAADMSQFAIITNTERQCKIAIISKMVVPDASLVDPQTTTTMPPELTAATGMDVLSHAFEAYVSTLSSPVTDIHALKAARLVAENLPAAFANPNDMARRSAMMTASLMAGLAFSNASLGLVHAMAHSVGGCCDLPHGDCNAILLEHVVPFNFEAAAERYAQLAEALGLQVAGLSREQVLHKLAGWLRDFRRSLNIPDGLGAMGVSRSSLGKLAQHAAADACLATNPRPASIQDIERLYETAF